MLTSLAADKPESGCALASCLQAKDQAQQVVVLSLKIGFNLIFDTWSSALLLFNVNELYRLTLTSLLKSLKTIQNGF